MRSVRRGADEPCGGAGDPPGGAVAQGQFRNGQREPGTRFVERILTVVATLRLQRRNVLDYVTSAYQAHLLGRPAPSLLPPDARVAASPTVR